MPTLADQAQRDTAQMEDFAASINTRKVFVIVLWGDKEEPDLYTVVSKPSEWLGTLIEAHPEVDTSGTVRFARAFRENSVLTFVSNDPNLESYARSDAGRKRITTMLNDPSKQR